MDGACALPVTLTTRPSSQTDGSLAACPREPLCRFLDLPVPDVPFPSGNTANDYEERIEQKMQGIRADCVRWAGYAGVAAAVVLGAAFQAARRWHRV